MRFISGIAVSTFYFFKELEFSLNINYFIELPKNIIDFKNIVTERKKVKAPFLSCIYISDKYVFSL